MHRIDKKRVVLVIDHEPSSHKAIARIGQRVDCSVLSFSDAAEFSSWLQANTHHAARRDMLVCMVFDSQFGGIFQQRMPAWCSSAPRICVSRSNKITLTLNSLRLGLFDFIAKPFNLKEMETSLQRAFTDARLLSGKPNSLESIIERIEQLTKRELEICDKLSRGFSGKQIASELSISVKTFYVHRTNLLQKTGARSTLELIRAYDVFAANRLQNDIEHEPIAIAIPAPNLTAQPAAKTDLPSFPLVKDIVRKNVLHVDADTTLRTAANLMIASDASSVVFQKCKQAHIFSMENVLEISHAGGSLDLPLSETFVEPAITLGENKTVLDALDLLESTKARFLLVTGTRRNSAIIGVLTYSDLLSAIDPTLFLEKKTIGQIVARKEPITFTPDWHLEDILCHLVQTEDSVIVVDAGKPVGIITAHDAFRIISSGMSTKGYLSEYMKQPIRSLPSSATIHDALIHLKANKIKRAIIVNDYGLLIGMLPQSEVVGFAYGYWTKLFRHQSNGLLELVTLLTKKAAKFEADSLTDPLTELGNRRYLNKFIDGEVERVRRYGAKAFSQIFIDIDHHKTINDLHGHAFGDEVIKLIGQTIDHLLRENDRVFRWGGDEFVVIAPHTDLNEAENLAARIRSHIEGLRFSKEHKASVSIGIGEYAPPECVAGFFDRIDQALFRAKSGGRNRVEISRHSAELPETDDIA